MLVKSGIFLSIRNKTNPLKCWKVFSTKSVIDNLIKMIPIFILQKYMKIVVNTIVIVMCLLKEQVYDYQEKKLKYD